MSSRKHLFCLITQSLLLGVCISARADAVSGNFRPYVDHSPRLIPVASDAVGYRLIVRVVLTNPINSKNARIGDPVKGRLKDAFVLGGKTYAAKNAIVTGHVSSYIAPRTLSQSFGSDRRFNSRAAIGIQFDEIIDESGVHIPVVGLLSRQTASFAGRNAPGREVRVDTQGRVVKAETVLSDTQRHIYNTARAATLVPIPGSMLLSMAGTPVVMGAAGAADPSFAYNKPVDASVKHRRVKGMIYAFLTNLPGAILVQSVVEKGNDILLNAGDQLAVDMQIKGNSQNVQAPITVADVHGAVLVKSNDTAPLPGSQSADYNDGLIAQSARYDDSTDAGERTVPDTGKLIRPINGGQRLLPAGEARGASRRSR
jgi:hypothetical protein